jgi:hypothetical protein
VTALLFLIIERKIDGSRRRWNLQDFPLLAIAKEFSFRAITAFVIR